jgi:hypothetical protein
MRNTCPPLGLLAAALLWVLALAAATPASPGPRADSATVAPGEERRLTPATPPPSRPDARPAAQDSTPPRQDQAAARSSSAMRLMVALGGLGLLAIIGLILVKSVTRP